MQCTFVSLWQPELRFLHSFPTRRSSDLFFEGGLGDVTFLGPNRLLVSLYHPDSLWTMDFNGNILSGPLATRSEEHTSELQSRLHLVCRLLIEKKNSRWSSWFGIIADSSS